MSDCAAANVALGQLPHLDRRLDAGADAFAFQRILEGECIQHRGEHAHVVGGGPLHAARTGGQAAEDIAAADDNGHFDVHRDDVGNFFCQPFENRGLNAIALLTGQHFSADFQQDAAVVGRTHAWPSWNRVNRRTFMFSPILAICCASRSLMTTDGSLMKACSSKQFSW